MKQIDSKVENLERKFNPREINEIRQEYLNLAQKGKMNSQYAVQNFMENYQKYLKGGLN